MAIQKIQYTNKEQLENDTTINDKYKCKADDLNEIKTVVNNNADEIPSGDNLVNVGSSVDTDYKVNVLTTKNLCNGTIQRIWLSSSGNECGIAPNSKGTYIKVSGGNYTISTTETQTRYRVACVDTLPTSNQSVAGYNGVGKDRTSDTITIDTTGHNYLIVDATNISKIQIEQGSTATTFEPFIPNTINVNNEKYSDTINVGTTINDKNRVNVLYSKNLLSLDNLQSGAYSINNGTYISGDNECCTKNKIEIDNTKNYVLSCGNTSTTNYIYVLYYDSNGTYLGHTTTTINNTIVLNTYTNYSQAKYVNLRFGITLSSLSTPMLEQGSTATTYTPFIPNTINVNNEKYTDTINVGTSINDKNKVNMLYSKNLCNNVIYNFAIILTSKIINYDSSSKMVYAKVPKNTYITISKSSVTNRFRVILLNEIPRQDLTFTDDNIAFSDDDSSTLTTTVNSRNYQYVAIQYTNRNQTTNIMVNIGNTPLDYEPYITPSINIDGEEIYSRPVVLWTNSNPTSSFAGQQITLNDNLGNYSYYEVKYLFASTTSRIELSTSKIDTDKYAFLGLTSSSGGNIASYRRLVESLSDNKITFGGGSLITATGTTTDNTICIPYKIIGYK